MKEIKDEQNQVIEVSNDIFDAVAKLGKGQFVSFPNYTNKNGEVANYVVNGNIDYGKAKERDFENLKDVTMRQMLEISEQKNIPFSVVLTAWNELFESYKPKEQNEQNARSKAQTDAYINFGKGLRMHKETETFHLYGFAVSKKVIVEGNYPQVNSSDKTKAKRAIEKIADFKTTKFRNFKCELGHCEYINLSGMTATID